MKITDARTAAAAFPDAPEECRDWCIYGPGMEHSADPEIARTAKVALELGDEWERHPTKACDWKPRDAFLRMMAGADDG